MSPYRRNVLVGVTVLGALVILAWMMIQFGASLAYPFAPKHMPIQLIAERADGLSEGSGVFFRGVQVGRIVRVARVPDDLTVIIDAEVDQSPPLPANVHGLIRFGGLLAGTSSMHLELEGDRPQGQLLRGATLSARYVPPDLLPPEFGELALEMRDTARYFRESKLIEHLDEQVQHLGEVIDSVQQIIDDPQLRDDFKATLANLRSTTERTNRLAGRLESLSEEASETFTQARGAIGRTETELVSVTRQIGDRLTQISTLLDQFQSIAAKVEQGQGTAGQILNDPRLYESMVDTAREMRATVSDLRRLVQQWEQEGVNLRLR